MQITFNVDDALLIEAKEATGLPLTASLEDVLRRFLIIEKQRRALDKLEGTGWDGPLEVRPSLETLAAEFRALTAHRQHTPSEDLMREGRAER
ncbi:hypothetical protein [Rhizobium sp. FY34]|uniref:hypothetical protein n=1 Tax=Rhizobium sp. FY34 TaxID=2562309 RepID=UPI00197D2BD8|nr:hypothetical protein [Rhizobium sp. FY34]